LDGLAGADALILDRFSLQTGNLVVDLLEQELGLLGLHFTVLLHLLDERGLLDQNKVAGVVVIHGLHDLSEGVAHFVADHVSCLFYLMMYLLLTVFNDFEDLVILNRV